MQISLSAGSHEDVDDCVDLWTRVIAARDGEGVAAEVAERARSAFAHTVVRFAVAGPPLQGFALTITRQDGIALLSRVCVDHSVSPRGLGTALVSDAIAHARDAGFEQLSLDVRDTNTRAIAIYRRAGFVATSDPWLYDAGDPVSTWSLGLR